MTAWGPASRRSPWLKAGCTALNAPRCSGGGDRPAGRPAANGQLAWAPAAVWVVPEAPRDAARGHAEDDNDSRGLAAPQAPVPTQLTGASEWGQGREAVLTIPPRTWSRPEHFSRRAFPHAGRRGRPPSPGTGPAGCDVCAFPARPWTARVTHACPGAEGHPRLQDGAGSNAGARQVHVSQLPPNTPDASRTQKPDTCASSVRAAGSHRPAAPAASRVALPWVGRPPPHVTFR